MDGVHDLGGMDGFGAVEAEHDEPVFHHPWEGLAFAMSMTMGARGVWNIDIGRYGIELLPPQVYLTSSYYERWYLRLENLLVEYGLVDRDEIANGRASNTGPASGSATFTARDVERVLARAFIRADRNIGPAFRVRRPCPRPQHPPQIAHPVAAVRARSRRCRRTGS